jgi:hypothetical protein
MMMKLMVESCKIEILGNIPYEVPLSCTVPYGTFQYISR